MTTTVETPAAAASRTFGPLHATRRFMASLRPLQLLGLTMLLLIVAFVLIYPLVPSYDPYGQDLTKILHSPALGSEHLFGTDSLGRDTASRLALGGRITLLIVCLITLVNAAIGLVIGIVAGYFGGRLDNALMAIAEIQLALPVILVLVALAASFGPGLHLMVVVLAVTNWTGYARVARTSARSLRERDFVLAPKLQGATSTRILRVHIVPSVITQMLILASTDLGTMILAMSSFDYLGLGVQAPSPSWGSMIGDSQRYLRQNAWQALVPGIAIFLAVAGMNLFSQRFTSEHDHTPVLRRNRRLARRAR